ncbi:MAG: XrtB/PEP-CTERM-associated transcriptional regulator EpsA [Betaproteobacteria bacterium]|jgi:transcriptional regulator EpsA
MNPISHAVEKVAVQFNQPVLVQYGEPEPDRYSDLAAVSASLAEENARTIAAPAALNDREVEILMLNLDASLRVHEHAHFFSWTQALLQSLIRHEVLICALRGGDPQSMRADSFSMVAADQAVFGEMFLRDASVAPGLIKLWEDRGFRPLICDAAASPIAKGLLAQELEAIGATQILAHGTHDGEGRVTGFFVFACVPGTIGARHAYLAQLVTPFVYSAWARTEVNGRAKCNDDDAVSSGNTKKITAREQEILRWVYFGKSNFEIGAILDISPLTVKNHVQKILRKLDVVNRAQAVGKALDLRILKP